MTIPQINADNRILRFTEDGDLSWPDILDSTKSNGSSSGHIHTMNHSDSSQLSADGSLDGL